MTDSVAPATRVERRPIASLTPAAYNPREIAPDALAGLTASVRRFGLVQPIIVNERTGNVVGGHQRLKVLEADGVTDTDVILVDLDLAEEKALNLALNSHAISGDWTPDALPLLDEILGALPDLARDLMLPALKDDLLGKFPAAIPEIEQDEVPPVPEDPETEVGDLYVLGRHRLLCGDSGDAGAVALLMDGALADLCFTSPPYAQQRDYGSADVSDWMGLMCSVFDALPMADDGQVLVNLGMVHRDGEWIPYWDPWIEWMSMQGWKRFGWYVWDQGAGMPGDWRGRLAPSHEWIFHFNRSSVRATKARATKHAGAVRGGKGLRDKNGKVPARTAGTDAIQSSAILDTIVRVHRQGASANAGGHPAPYPPGLPAHFVKSWHGLVYDPFVGSGTTIVAAEQLDRSCYALEIDPGYADVVVQRWENLTGLKAERIRG